MKKNCFLFLLFAINAVSSFGKSIDAEKAYKVGSNFLLRHGMATANVQQLKLVNEANVFQSKFYIFSSDNCFVLVSAEDAVVPVLAYSTDKRFDVTDIPSHVAEFLGNYTKQINYIINKKIASHSNIVEEWHNLENNLPLHNSERTTKTTAVSPLLVTTWNQAPGFNLLCPYDATCSSYQNNRVVTGCVATSMSQVMKFWNWPGHGSGSHSYSSSYGVLSADFGATTYTWGSMPLNTYNLGVETIMYHAGVAVEMGYGCNGSGANMAGGPNTAESALRDYFCYVSTLHAVDRGGYSDPDWISMIENDLNQNQPVLYFGYGSVGGHAWVVDGYDASDYFHCNWGWSGMDDGYYYINSMVPAPDPNGDFNSSQGAIVGIVPDAPAITLDSTTTTICVGHSYNLSYIPSGGTWASSYPARATINSSGVVTAVSAGAVALTYTIPTTCGNRYKVKIITVQNASSSYCSTVGIANNEIKPEAVIITPNPNSGRFQITLPEAQIGAAIYVYDMLGRVVHSKEVAAGDKQVFDMELGVLPKGTYIIKVASGEHVYRDKIIIE